MTTEPLADVVAGLEAHADVLAEIVSFRRAARSIIGDESLPLRQKYVGLIRLAKLARTEAQFPRAAQGVVADEASVLLHPGDAPVAATPAEAAIRRLLAQGQVACGECRRPLPSLAVLDKWRRLGEDAALRAARREALVS